MDYSLYTCLELGHGVRRCALVPPCGWMVPGIVASSSLSSVWSRLTQRYTAGESRKLRLNGVKASFLDDTSGIPLPCLPSSPLFLSIYRYNSGSPSAGWLKHECRPAAPESNSVTALPEFRLRAALTECMRIFSTKV